jgi:hypothetical protein
MLRRVINYVSTQAAGIIRLEELERERKAREAEEEMNQHLTNIARRWHNRNHRAILNLCKRMGMNHAQRRAAMFAYFDERSKRCG